LATKLVSELRKDDPSVSSYQQPVIKTDSGHHYVYDNKSLIINKRRRKDDMAQHVHGSGAKSTDRRKKLRDGIIIVKYDRRQNNDANYSGPEKRSGAERRSGKNRRKSDV
jgi:hypothetical protein